MLPQLEIAGAFLGTRLRTFPTRARLESYQQRKLMPHLAWLQQHVPFYRDLDAAAWTSAPLMEREMFMRHFRELNAPGIGRREALDVALQAEQERDFTPMIGDISVGLSSGTSSSGEVDARGIFLASGRERYRWAGTVLAKVLPHGWQRRQRVALFLRSNSNLYTSVRSRRLRFEYFDLATAVEGQLEALNRLEPTVIVAPPSRLRALAEVRRKLLFSPATLVAGAEVLEDIDRREIEAVFGRPVRQIYQATEGFLGVSCPMGHLHLNEDLLIVQRDYLDKATGRFAPIITDFRRKTQPIIRYRLDDILRETTCTCGSPMQAVRVEGRASDVWTLSAHDGGSVRIFPDDVRAVFAPFDLEHYRAHQASADCVHITIAPNTPELIAGLRAGFVRLFDRRESALPRLTFAPYLSPNSEKKLRRVTRAS